MTNVSCAETPPVQHFKAMRQNGNFYAIYCNERVMEGTVTTHLMPSLICAPASEYDVTKYAKKPTTTCYNDAKKFEVIQYQFNKLNIDVVLFE